MKRFKNPGEVFEYMTDLLDICALPLVKVGPHDGKTVSLDHSTAAHLMSECAEGCRKSANELLSFVSPQLSV